MNSKLIIIFEGKPMNADLIKQVLNDNGIDACLKDQLMGTIAPWQVSAGGFEPVKVEILEEDKEKALKLIDEFNKSS